MGVLLTSNFDLNTALPLDNRTVVDTYSDLDKINIDVLYEGLPVYVKDEQTYYVYMNNDSDDVWKPLGYELSKFESYKINVSNFVYKIYENNEMVSNEAILFSINYYQYETGYIKFAIELNDKQRGIITVSGSSTKPMILYSGVGKSDSIRVFKDDENKFIHITYYSESNTIQNELKILVYKIINYNIFDSVEIGDSSKLNSFADISIDDLIFISETSLNTYYPTAINPDSPGIGLNTNTENIKTNNIIANSILIDDPDRTVTNSREGLNDLLRVIDPTTANRDIIQLSINPKADEDKDKNYLSFYDDKNWSTLKIMPDNIISDANTVKFRGDLQVNGNTTLEDIKAGELWLEDLSLSGVFSFGDTTQFNFNSATNLFSYKNTEKKVDYNIMKLQNEKIILGNSDTKLHIFSNDLELGRNSNGEINYKTEINTRTLKIYSNTETNIVNKKLTMRDGNNIALLQTSDNMIKLRDGLGANVQVSNGKITAEGDFEVSGNVYINDGTNKTLVHTIPEYFTDCGSLSNSENKVIIIPELDLDELPDGYNVAKIIVRFDHTVYARYAYSDENHTMNSEPYVTLNGVKVHFSPNGVDPIYYWGKGYGNWTNDIIYNAGSTVTFLLHKYVDIDSDTEEILYTDYTLVQENYVNSHTENQSPLVSHENKALLDRIEDLDEPKVINLTLKSIDVTTHNNTNDTGAGIIIDVTTNQRLNDVPNIAYNISSLFNSIYSQIDNMNIVHDEEDGPQPVVDEHLLKFTIDGYVIGDISNNNLSIDMGLFGSDIGNIFGTSDVISKNKYLIYDGNKWLFNKDSVVNQKDLILTNDDQKWKLPNNYYAPKIYYGYTYDASTSQTFNVYIDGITDVTQIMNENVIIVIEFKNGLRKCIRDNNNDTSRYVIINDNDLGFNKINLTYNGIDDIDNLYSINYLDAHSHEHSVLMFRINNFKLELINGEILAAIDSCLSILDSNLNTIINDMPTYSKDSVSTEPSYTLLNNETQIFSNTNLSSIELLLPSGTVNPGFNAGITFYCGSDSFDFVTPDNIYYTGEDCIDGIFVPSQKDHVYEVLIEYNGITWRGRVD